MCPNTIKSADLCVFTMGPEDHEKTPLLCSTKNEGKQNIPLSHVMIMIKLSASSKMMTNGDVHEFVNEQKNTHGKN